MIHIVCCDLLKLVPLLSIANIPIHPKDLIERVMVIENACQETPSKKSNTKKSRSLWRSTRLQSDAVKKFHFCVAGNNTIFDYFYYSCSICRVRIAPFYSLMSPTWTFVGIENYISVFELDQFWGSLWRGLIFMVGSTIIQVSVGLWLAFTLNDISIGQKYLTSIVFTAYLIPTVVVSLVALFLFDQSFGLFHMIGSEWFNLWDSTNYILGSNAWAMPS